MAAFEGARDSGRRVLGHLLAFALGTTLLAAPLVPGTGSPTLEPVGLEAPTKLVLGQLTRLSPASFTDPVRTFPGLAGFLAGVVALWVSSRIKRRALGVGWDSFKRWKRWERLQLEGG